jgi:NCAIR mutase (PurE)-related protein
VDAEALSELIEGVRRGDVAPDEAVAALRRLPFADLGFARVDHHRTLRQGLAETVFGPGKEPEQCAAIVAELLAQPGSAPIVLSRADSTQVAVSISANPGGDVVEAGGGGPPNSRLHTVVWRPAAERSERVAVVTAGTADLPVADECAATLLAHGVRAVRITDVGVVGGLTPAPVIAVPTSVGYGSSLEGVTALLGMLASCASGMTVVGIDNGFGAAIAVLRVINSRVAERTDV